MKERNNERMGVFIKEYLYLYLSYCHFDYTKTKNKIKLFKNKTFYLLVLLKLSFCMFIFCKALIAQSVEHGANNARVAGSKPAESIFYTHYITHITEGNKIKQNKIKQEREGERKRKEREKINKRKRKINKRKKKNK